MTIAVTQRFHQHQKKGKNRVKIKTQKSKSKKFAKFPNMGGLAEKKDEGVMKIHYQLKKNREQEFQNICETMMKDNKMSGWCSNLLEKFAKVDELRDSECISKIFSTINSYYND